MGGACRRFVTATVLVLIAAACNEGAVVEQVSTTTTSRATSSTSVVSTTSTSLVEPVETELPPLCTDLYPDLEIEGDLASDRFVADAQVDRSYYGLPTSEGVVRQVLASLEGAEFYEGPYSKDEWVTVSAHRSVARDLIWPEQTTPVTEWLRDNNYYHSTYFPSLGTMTIAYRPVTDPELAILVAEAEEAIAALPPGADRWEVSWRQVDYSLKELSEVMRQPSLNGMDQRVWLDDRANRVAVDLGVSDPGDAGRIPDELLPYACLATPRTKGNFGPQPASGEGWRLLAISDDPTNLERSLYLTDSRTEVEETWQQLGIPDPVPTIDFDREIVAVWETGIFALCDNGIRFDGPDWDPDRNRLDAELTDFGYPSGCLAAGATRRYVVAVEADELPHDIRLGELVVTRVEHSN